MPSPHPATKAQRRRLLLGLAATLGAAAWGSDAAAEPPPTLLAARTAAADGAPERADALYIEACAAADAPGGCFLEAGLMWSRAGLYARALPWLEQARRADHLNPETHLACAVALDGLGRNPEAARLYRQVLLMAPGHAVALFNLGRLELLQGDLERAEHTLRDLIARQPEHWQAHNNLGLVLLERRQPTAALAPLRQALRLHPDDPGIIYNLGRARAAQGDMKRALALFDQALLGWGPGDLAAVPLHFARGDALFHLKRFEEAADAYEAALALDPQHGGARLNLGAALANLGRNQEALDALERAARDGAGDAAVYRQVAVLRVEAQDWRGALSALQEAQRRGDADASLFAMLGQIHEALGERDDAAAARREACRRGDRASCPQVP